GQMRMRHHNGARERSAASLYFRYLQHEVSQAGWMSFSVLFMLPVGHFRREPKALWLAGHRGYTSCGALIREKLWCLPDACENLRPKFVVRIRLAGYAEIR